MQAPQDAQETKYKKELKAFKKIDSLAQLILVTSMSNSQGDLTATCSMSYEVWQKLVSAYEQSSGQRVDRLMEQFFMCSMNTGEDIAIFVSRLQRYF